MAYINTLEEYYNSINKHPSQQENTIDTSLVSSYLSPTPDIPSQRPPTSLEEFQPELLEERSLGHQVFTGAYTLDDLEKNPEFQTRAERFMESIKDDEDIFEYLRDSDFSLSSAMVRAGQVKGWSDQTKEDYNYLRSMFDNSDLGSTKQFMQLAKDMTIDIIRDPINWLAAIFLVPSAGQSATATAATTLAAKEIAKKGLLQLGKESLKGSKRSAIIGAAEGASWGGVHDYFIQNAEVELGMRDEVNWGQTAITTGMGAGIGGIFGGAIGVVSSATPLLRQKLSQYSDDVSISKKGKVDRAEKLEEWQDDTAANIVGEGTETPKPKVTDKTKPDSKKSKKEGIKKIRKHLTVIANTVGKPVAEFVEVAQQSVRMQQLLGHFRYDWSKTLLKGVDKIMLSTYGEALNFRMFKYLTELRGAVGQLNRSDVTFWKPSTWKNSLNEIQNNHLVFLLRLNQKEFDDIAKLTKKDKVNPDVPLLEERARTADLMDQDIDVIIDILDTNLKDDLGNLIDSDVTEAAAKIRDILGRIFDEASGGTKVFNGVGDIPLNLMQGGSRVSGFFPRHFSYAKILDDRGKAGESGFEDIIYRSEHSKPLLDPKEAAKIEVIDPLTGQIKKDPITGKAEKLFPAGTKSVDEEVFGRTSYLRIKKLVDAGNEDGARKLKARLIVDDMLDRRYAPFEFGTESSGGAGASFLQHRVFTTLDDNMLAPYLDNNVEDVIEKYIQNASRAITRTAYFGRTEKDFINKWINGKDNIREQLRAKGVKEEEIKNITDKLQKMYRRVTGLDAEEIRLKGGLGTALDVIKLSQQAAHLPLATLSSITEPMIMLSRVDTVGGKVSSGGQVGKAIIKGVKKDIDKFRYFAQRARGKEVKGFADMQDEYWHEAYKVGLAIEQGVMAHIEGLYGEAARGGWTRKLQNAFFRANLLTSWTGAVQLASFTTAKRLIRENTEQLVLHNNSLKKNGTRLLSKEKEEMLTKQLWDLGIDEKDAQRWYRNSLEDGVFDEGRSRGASSSLNPSQRRDQLSFYENRYTKGANRFTREIILNPSTSEANRPLWFSHPAGQLLAQFAGYPTVFNNTILKRWSHEVAEDAKRAGKGQLPQATGRILGTAVSMTTVAVFMNALRSQGRSLEQEDETIIIEAIQRWGGLGPADILYRMQQNTTYGSGPAGTVIKALPGPIVSDVVDSIAYRKGIPEILATNTPFFSALPKEARDAYKKGARDLNKALTAGMFKEDKPSKYYSPFATLPYAKGGVVLNVPNASVEPDEKKVRGLPITYAELGGVLAQDVEDRKGYVLGGIVDRIARSAAPSTKKSLMSLPEEASEDEVIRHLTKEVRKAEPIFESNRTTSLYKKAEADKFAKNVDDEAIRYVNSDRLNELEEELRYSTELGVKATTKSKASGGKKIKYKGRLRIVRPLELGDVSPEALTGSKFIEAIQTNTALRNNIINSSPLPNEDATKLVKKLVDEYTDTKKFVIGYSEHPIEVTQPLLDIKQSIKARETLTDLGYDSIRYNDSEYILFNNNQFRVNKKLRLREGFAEGGEVESTKDWKYYEYAPDLIDMLKEQNINVKMISPELDSKWGKRTGFPTQPVFLPNTIDLNRVENNPDAEIFLKALSPDARSRDYINSMKLARQYINEDTAGTIYIPEKRYYVGGDMKYKHVDHYNIGKQIREDIAYTLLASDIVKEGLKKPVRSLTKFAFRGEEAFRDPEEEKEYLESIGIDKHGNVIGRKIDTEEDVWRRIGKGKEYTEMINATKDIYAELENLGLLDKREGVAEGCKVEKLTDEEYAQLFNVVKSEESPQEERESAWRAITIGIRAGVGAISEGLSKVFTDEKGLTKEQVDFLRKSLYQGGRVQAKFGDRIRKSLLDRFFPDVTPPGKEIKIKLQDVEDKKPVEDKEPVVVQEEGEKQVISDEELAAHKEYIFNEPDFNITNPTRMSNARLLEDTIWQMESDQGKNTDIELNGPYQMSEDTQWDAINLAFGLRAKHSEGRGSNFSEEQLDYLENTPRNELQDNASRLLMNHIFFTRAVKGEKTGAGTKLLQDYHENPTWEKAQDIYLKLWVYHTKEEYAEIMKKQTGEEVDIGPNLLRGKEYFNENYGKSLQELQEIAPVKESWYPGKRIKEKIDEIPAHAEVYLKKVLFGNREPITEKVFSPEEYGRVTEGMRKEILQNLDKSLFRNNISATFFDTQGRLRDRYGQDYDWESMPDFGSFEPYFGYMGELPREIHYILGSARYNLNKGDYNTEKLTINSDQYDFGEQYGGLQREPGFNIDNLREYYQLLKSKQVRRAAERFGNRQLPDQKTVDRWEQDYGIKREAEYVPVNMTFPVADIFSEDEWANLQGMEGEEPQERVASLLEPPMAPEYVLKDADLSLEEWQAKYMPELVAKGKKLKAKIL